MLPKKIETALNNQINQEANASYFYLSMASWCEYEGLNGAAKFLYIQSEEERGHMLKIFRYINEAGGHAITPVIKKFPAKYKSISDVFEKSLMQEISNTKSINSLVESCLNEKDYSTFHFLQWYVAEQHEEEMTFKNILSKIEILGSDGKGIYMIDKAIGKMVDEESN